LLQAGGCALFVGADCLADGGADMDGNQGELAGILGRDVLLGRIFHGADFILSGLLAFVHE